MSKAVRRKFQDAEKVAILKRHLVEKVPVSDLCDEHKLYPNQFYDWLKKFFENGHLAFAQGRKPKADEQGKDRKIEQLETRLTRKNEVLAELMEAHCELKKSLGEPSRPAGCRTTRGWTSSKRRCGRSASPTSRAR